MTEDNPELYGRFRQAFFWGDIDRQTRTCDAERLPNEETPVDEGKCFDLNIQTERAPIYRSANNNTQKKWLLIQNQRATTTCKISVLSYQSNVHEIIY